MGVDWTVAANALQPITFYTMPSSLDKLVDDIVIQILEALSVRSILSLRQTSRRYYLLSKLHCIWYTRFYADVLACNIPVPGPARPLSLLSATELERRTLRALYLHRVWPRLSPKTLVSRHHQHVDQVVLIPGGTELLTVQGDKVVHWLIVSWPGFTQGLKHVGEWTPFEGVPCRVVKDGDVPGVIAVGPREPFGSHRFAKVLSTNLKMPFTMLCDYARAPGVVVGIWGHLLLLDTTRELGGGGLELLDWHAQKTGSALLPCFPELFGKFLDFVVFAGHILVVWERCMSVFSIPRVPADGQVVVEHKRVFIFQEEISRPIGFTTCVARHLTPIRHHYLDEGKDVGWAQDGQHKRSTTKTTLDMSPALTIAARSRRRAENVSMMMLIPLVGEAECVTADMDAFPYRLACLPPHTLATSSESSPWPSGDQGVARDPVQRICTSICLGSSGRGLFVVGKELRLVSPDLLVLPPFEMQIGPVFETGKPLYFVDQQRDLDRLRVDDENADPNAIHMHVWDGAEEEDVSGDKVDFDEGMGRFVVAKECGGVEVVQLE